MAELEYALRLLRFASEALTNVLMVTPITEAERGTIERAKRFIEDARKTLEFRETKEVTGTKEATATEIPYGWYRCPKCGNIYPAAFISEHRRRCGR